MTKYDTSWTFLTELRDKGRAEADRWLGSCAQYLGTGESSVDLRKEFIEDSDSSSDHGGSKKKSSPDKSSSKKDDSDVEMKSSSGASASPVSTDASD